MKKEPHALPDRPSADASPSTQEDGDNMSHRIPTSFGAYLRSLRMENGLTLREMAEKIGLSNGYVSLIETGERRPKATVELAKRIAYGLNTSMDEVCTAMGMQRAHPLLERAVELLREGEAEIASGRAKMAEAEEMLCRVRDLMSAPDQQEGMALHLLGRDSR